MPTKLEKAIKRELEHDGVLYTVTVSPDVAPEGDAVAQLPHRAFSAFRSRAPPSFR